MADSRKNDVISRSSPLTPKGNFLSGDVHRNRKCEIASETKKRKGGSKTGRRREGEGEGRQAMRKLTNKTRN